MIAKLRAERDQATAERDALAAELTALRATKMFRLMRGPRRVYGFLREFG